MSHHHAASAEHKPHVLPLRTYFTVWISLLVLTLITVRVSYLDFGTWNLIVAVMVATIKASLVVLFFMHLKYDEPFNAIIFVGSIGCLAIFFILTLADTVERGTVDPIEAEPIQLVPSRPDLMETERHGEGDVTPGEGHDAEPGPGKGESAPGPSRSEENPPHDGSGGH